MLPNDETRKNCTTAFYLLTMLNGDKIQLLRRSHFLDDMSDTVISMLAQGAELMSCSASETVVEKGTAGTMMYFIVAGRFKVHDNQVELAILGEGEVFGEMSALDAGERTASVTAENESQLLCLDSALLYQALSREPGSFRSIIRAICHRERRIIDDVTERSRKVQAYEKELEIGRRIQAGFLPLSLPEVPGWHIAAYLKAAREVAGDFYDVFPLNDIRYTGLVIGDVCDKGVGAALFMTLFRSLTRASCLYGYRENNSQAEEPDDPESILANSVLTTNRYIATTHGNSSMFASMFFGILDNATGRLVYVNGGHEAPVIFREGGTRETLSTTGPVLGLFAAATYAVEKTQLARGDLLFGYTDGVTEAKNRQEELFTEEQLLQRANHQLEDPQEFIDEILEYIRIHCGGADQFDDITMLAVRRSA